MRAALLACVAARAACGETGSGEPGSGSTVAGRNYTDGRGCPPAMRAGLYEVPHPDGGCCLGEGEDWCHNNYEEFFTCGTNACGEIDCCIPEECPTGMKGVELMIEGECAVPYGVWVSTGLIPLALICLCVMRWKERQEAVQEREAQKQRGIRRQQHGAAALVRRNSAIINSIAPVQRV